MSDRDRLGELPSVDRLATAVVRAELPPRREERLSGAAPSCRRGAARLSGARSGSAARGAAQRRELAPPPARGPRDEALISRGDIRRACSLGRIGGQTAGRSAPRRSSATMSCGDLPLDSASRSSLRASSPWTLTRMRSVASGSPSQRSTRAGSIVPRIAS
jgi:hypothetical protein